MHCWQRLPFTPAKTEFTMVRRQPRPPAMVVRTIERRRAPSRRTHCVDTLSAGSHAAARNLLEAATGEIARVFIKGGNYAITDNAWLFILRAL